ncbi:hypothetical protein LCGC14_0383290 [marine sediment metagenome]|uniref:Uncharacterized protein n=1 Tax=marine sediment metagenome TaxID=412755 RepID=A0A0F9T1J7_9ZZZZ
MADINITHSNGEITIKFKPDRGTVSRSGKTLIVATTSGFVPVEGTDLRISLNVIKPKGS